MVRTSVLMIAQWAVMSVKLCNVDVGGSFLAGGNTPYITPNLVAFTIPVGACTGFVEITTIYGRHLYAGEVFVINP